MVAGRLVGEVASPAGGAAQRVSRQAVPVARDNTEIITSSCTAFATADGDCCLICVASRTAACPTLFPGQISPELFRIVCTTSPDLLQLTS